MIGQANGSVASRSLFGGSALSKGAIQCIDQFYMYLVIYQHSNCVCVGVATSWCFQLAQGDSLGRVDLNGSGNNAFARGSSVEGAG